MAVDLRSTFSKRLKQAIHDYGGPNATIRAYAKKIDIPENTLYGYTSGHVFPSVFVLYLLCSDLGVSADWLLGLSDVEERKNYSPHNE